MLVRVRQHAAREAADVTRGFDASDLSPTPRFDVEAAQCFDMSAKDIIIHELVHVQMEEMGVLAAPDPAHRGVGRLTPLLKLLLLLLL